MKPILMLSGKQGSGKTSNVACITRVCSDLGFHVYCLKFAAPLYEMHDVILEMLKRWGARPADMPKDGDLLQILGTEYGRNILGPNVWVDILRREIDVILKQDNEAGKALVIVDDMRFENEFDAFPDAYRVRLEADAKLRKERCSYWREREEHVSETGLDTYSSRSLFDLKVSTDQARIEVTAHAIRVAWFNNETNHMLYRKNAIR